MKWLLNGQLIIEEVKENKSLWQIEKQNLSWIMVLKLKQKKEQMTKVRLEKHDSK